MAKEWPTNLKLGLGAAIAMGAILLSQQNAIVGGTPHIGGDSNSSTPIVPDNSPGSTGNATGVPGVPGAVASGNVTAGKTTAQQVGPLSPGPAAGTNAASSGASSASYNDIGICACFQTVTTPPGTFEFTFVTTSGTAP